MADEPLSRVEEILEGGSPPLLSRIEKLLKEGGAGGGSVTPEQIAEAVEAYLDEHGVSITETDPTVPEWAKAAEKPTYTASEVGALPSDAIITVTVDDSGGSDVASMTALEIKTAVDAGKIVRVKYMTAEFDYAYRTPTTVVFSVIVLSDFYEMSVDNNGTVSVDMVPIPNVSGKLDIAQGAANAGKFMVVGSDGNITAVTMQAWSGGSY